MQIEGIFQLSNGTHVDLDRIVSVEPIGDDYSDLDCGITVNYMFRDGGTLHAFPKIKESLQFYNHPKPEDFEEALAELNTERDKLVEAWKARKASPSIEEKTNASR